MTVPQYSAKASRRRKTVREIEITIYALGILCAGCGASLLWDLLRFWW